MNDVPADQEDALAPYAGRIATAVDSGLVIADRLLLSHGGEDASRRTRSHLEGDMIRGQIERALYDVLEVADDNSWVVFRIDEITIRAKKDSGNGTPAAVSFNQLTLFDTDKVDVTLTWSTRRSTGRAERADLVVFGPGKLPVWRYDLMPHINEDKIDDLISRLDGVAPRRAEAPTAPERRRKPRIRLPDQRDEAEGSE